MRIITRLLNDYKIVTFTTVRLLSCDKPPSCKGATIDERTQALWEIVKGTEIVVSEPKTPDRFWQCGTNAVYEILDADYFSSIGADLSHSIFVCHHAFEAK